MSNAERNLTLTAEAIDAAQIVAAKPQAEALVNSHRVDSLFSRSFRQLCLK